MRSIWWTRVQSPIESPGIIRGATSSPGRGWCIIHIRRHGFVLQERIISLDTSIYAPTPTRAIGTPGLSEPDLICLQLDAGESLLLCSDGPALHLDDNDILDVVSRYDAQEACQRLADAANRRGGGDNISIVLLGRRSV